jgi:PAB1-binding protein PBP1
MKGVVDSEKDENDIDALFEEQSLIFPITLSESTYKALCEELKRVSREREQELTKEDEANEIRGIEIDTKVA